jgi:uncharacterized glyoxalase superfamily protein PhnB
MAQRIVPLLAYEDALPDGATIYLADPTHEYVSPRCHREACEAMRRAYDHPYVVDGHFVEVDDLETHCERARAAGATILREPEEPGHGFRIYATEDLEGHRWMLGQRSG